MIGRFIMWQWSDWSYLFLTITTIDQTALSISSAINVCGRPLHAVSRYDLFSYLQPFVNCLVITDSASNSLLILLILVFHAFEAGIADAISSFK